MHNTLTDATRRLRLALGDTQQQFAQRTGLAISTVVRYELSRPPHGKALAQFAVLAERNGLHDVARTFAYATGNAPETSAMHAALDSLWFNRENLAGWPMLARRSIIGTVYFGVSEAPVPPGRLVFHAWLRCGR